MWKANVQKVIKEIRFIVKQDTPHHGTWRFINKDLSEIALLSPGVFVSIDQINNDFKTPSSILITYGDDGSTEDEIPTEGLSAKDVAEALKAKVAFGLTLPRVLPKDNGSRNLPIDVVEAHKYVKYLDDGF